jgi:lipopolysaccharide/colanic/teichoic acid biosynthesis glycosyltransferase
MELFREQIEFVRGQNIRRVYLLAKRVIDVVGAAVGLVLLFPFIALVSLLVKLTDGGPILYLHRRVGEGGREFLCYKFRTMVVDADEMKPAMQHLNRHSDPRTFKIEDDPRTTRVGRWLRRASFDEVPQLWNILLGDMSLVGPRPPVPSEVEKYSLWEMQRLSVRPGLTCIWQVSGRSRLPFPKQLEMDIEYIRKRSILFDLRLVFATFRAVVSGDGAC